MAGQPETTRLEWERTGPFVPFEIARSRTQHVPEEYIKNAHWGISVLQAWPGPKDGVSAQHFGADGPIILRTETVPKAFRVLG